MPWAHDGPRSRRLSSVRVGECREDIACRVLGFVGFRKGSPKERTIRINRFRAPFRVVRSHAVPRECTVVQSDWAKKKRKGNGHAAYLRAVSALGE